MKKITLITLFISTLFVSACGQKGALILDTVPVQKNQTSTNDVNDQIPVKDDVLTEEQ